MKKLFSIALCLLVLLLAGCGGEDAAPTTEATEPPLTFQGAVYSPETELLTAATLTEEDVAALTAFPNLKTLDAADCTDHAMLLTAKQACPQLDIICKVTIGGIRFGSSGPVISVERVSVHELEEILPLLRWLQ